MWSSTHTRSVHTLYSYTIATYTCIYYIYTFKCLWINIDTHLQAFICIHVCLYNIYISMCLLHINLHELTSIYIYPHLNSYIHTCNQLCNTKHTCIDYMYRLVCVNMISVHNSPYISQYLYMCLYTLVLWIQL